MHLPLRLTLLRGFAAFALIHFFTSLWAQPGTLDPSFAGSGADATVRAMAVQPDGKILIGGEFTTYNGTTRNRIARLNADGSLDTSFDPGSGANGLVNAMALQPDGKILIGGEFTTYNGTTRNRIARLNADGSLDMSFDPGSGANSWVYAMALQLDGKILIGGHFTNYNGTTRNRIARLNANGSLDTSFDPGNGANNLVLTISTQPDGKILIGGGFTVYKSTPRNRIARINADNGSPDSFDLAGGPNITVWAIAVQPDGKILIGGEFTDVNGTPRNRITRVSANGGPDSFDPGSGANNGVFAISMQPDGKILIGGNFSIYNGTTRNNIARLNANGGLDTSFDPGSGTNGLVNTIALQPDGKILIGGAFTSYNGTAKNRVARLNTCTAPSFTACPVNQSVNVAPNTCAAPVAYAAEASGAPAPALTYAFTGATTGSGSGTGSNTTFSKGVTNVVLTASSTCTPAATCSFTVTVVDNQLPTITCPSGSPFTRNTDAGACDYTVQGGEFNPSAFNDNCPGASITNSFNNSASLTGAKLSKGPNTITWTVTDATGLNASCQISVTVVDNQPPTITCPSGSPFTRNTDAGACDYTVQGGEFNLSAFNDNCPGASISNSFNNSASLTGAKLSKGPNTITWTVTDATGLNASCQISVTVVDNQLPTITCPSGSPFTLNADAGECNYTVQGAQFNPSAFNDNCPGASITNSFNNSASLAGADLPKGPNTITWTVTDATGLNTASCQISVTVVDNQLPTITCPSGSPFTRNTNAGACTYTVQGAEFAPLSFNDNCPGAFITNSLNNLDSLAGANLPKGPNTITWTVTDATGLNTTSCQISVTVVDSQKPTITCPSGSPFTRSTDAGACNYMVRGAEFAPSVFNDNCPGAFITNSLNNLDSLAGANLPKGPNTITWTVTDATGLNTVSCQISVTVVDNQLPTITCPTGSPFTRSTDAGECNYTVQGAEFNPLSFNDNCPGASITNSFNNLDSLAGAELPNGPNTITWTVTDATGLNTASCQISVTVTDNQKPTITCPSNAVVAPTSFNPCSALVNNVNANYNDNCSGAGLSYILSGATIRNGNGQLSGSSFNVGLTTARYTVTDGAGLSASCTFTVTVTNCILVLSGAVKWEQDTTLGVGSAVVSMTGAATGSYTTGASGDYQFSITNTTGNFTFKPTKAINKLNGVTVADVTAVQQFAANQLSLPAPFKRIAADVNKSNSVTSLDASLLNQALLGNPTALSQITSWRFVPSAYVFPNPNVPWGFPEQIDLVGVTASQSNLNFKGIKLGDVVSTWANPANFAGAGGSRLVLRVQDQVLQAGKTVVTEFRADQLDDLIALQFALQFDPSVLQLDTVEMLGGSPLTLENFGLYQVSEGEIRVVWSREKSVSLSEASPLFRLRFRVLESGARLNEVLGLADAADPELPARVYNSAFAESGVELRYQESTATGQNGPTPGFWLENYPNPFANTTTLRFALPQAGVTELRIRDATGRLLLARNKYYPAGKHEEVLQLDGIAGVLYAELLSEQGVVLRKMLAVR